MTIFRKCSSCLAGSALAALLLVLPGLASAATYYVSTTGDDTAGDGSAGNPWQTITHAAANVPAGTAVSPNEISVEAGLYNVGNGESFPIVFANNFVSLTGADSATTTINAGGLDALDVNAKGFAVSGFTFQNASYAIDISEGGFTIFDNVFDTNVSDGVYFDRSDSDRTTGISFADMAITGNTFKTTNDGIYINVDIDFDNTVDGLTATFGDFSISGNTFSLTSGDGVYVEDLFSPSDMDDGTVTAGDFIFTGNTVTDGYYGLYFYSSVDYLDNSQLTVGNTNVSNNTFTDQTGYGIYIDYWDISYLNDTYYGGTEAVLGSLTISSNTVTSVPGNTSYGIYLSDLGYIYDIYGYSTVTTGPVIITGNTINVYDDGLYLYIQYIQYLGEEYWDDPVKVSIGAITITGNTITSTDDQGAYIDYYDIAYDTYGRSAVALGPFTFSNNTVNADGEALYFYVSYWGEDMYEDSSLVVNALKFANNTLTSTNSNAFTYNINEASYEMYGNAWVDIKATTITGNTITSNGSSEALYFYLDDFAYYMYDNSVSTMAPITVDNNAISAAAHNGIYIYYYAEYIACYLEDNAAATMPDWIFTNNTIDAGGSNYGLYLDNEYNPYYNYDNSRAVYGSFLIDGNTFNPDKNVGMLYGIYMEQEYLGESFYGPATAAYGDITITDNTFYAMDGEAIYLYFYNIGYSFTGAPTLTMGDIEIGDNTIDGAEYGIELDFDYLYTADAAKVTFGKVNVIDNTLTNISEYGIYVYYYNYNSDHDTATLTVGAPTISGNTVSGTAATDHGIYLYVDNSTDGITMGMPTISGNTVSGFNQGIYLEGVEEAALTCNYVENNTLAGMRFQTAGTSFTVNTNSLVGNGVGLSIDNGYAAVINAENNWWGDKAGPVACASCNGVDPGDSGTVDFTPWLTYQPDKSRCGKPFPWLMFVPAITGMGK